MKGKKLLGLIGVLIALSTVLAGCEALPSSSVETTTSSSAMAGRLQINITDAPSKPEIEQVWLTVAGVKIHLDSVSDNYRDYNNHTGYRDRI
jgi:hypothetical protein